MNATSFEEIYEIFQNRPRKSVTAEILADKITKGFYRISNETLDVIRDKYRAKIWQTAK